MVRRLTSLLLLAASLLASPHAWAQQMLTIVVNFPPGGANDVAARLIATDWTTPLGLTVVVKNSVDAAGTIGGLEVVRARPDGLTLLLSPIGPVAIQPSFMRPDPYATRDLLPVCQVTDAALLMQTYPT